MFLLQQKGKFPSQLQTKVSHKESKVKLSLQVCSNWYAAAVQ